MANDCCGPLIPAPDPDAVPNSPREEAGSGNYCNASVADTEASDATNSGQGDTNQDPQAGCCFSGEHSSVKVTSDIDVPHCCRGKTSPCCDTSCLERLALRECAISAVAPAGANAQTKSKQLLSHKVTRHR
jgi:Cu2+-exporting ATPase